MSYCSFCKTKLARGELLSYPKEKIIGQFKSALADGCKEFWITSQDNGCYGFDIYRKEKYFLPQLLQDLLLIDGDFRIRVGMCNPNHVDRIKEDLVQVYKNPKMFKFLHIPIQSGNDRVLKDMKRSYTVKTFIDIVSFFRNMIPGIIISTDIIVGFPGETDAEFDDTLDLIGTVGFDVLNFSRFWSRNGTVAAKMKQLYSGIVKERSIRVKELFDKLYLENNLKFVGKEFSIIIDERGLDGMIIGRDDYYRQVSIRMPSKSIVLGDRIIVRIVGVKGYVLVGEEL